MKKVMVEIEVEDWVEFVAQDEDGYFGGYEFKPEPIDDEWDDMGGKCIHLFSTDKNQNWKNTLTEVKS